MLCAGREEESGCFHLNSSKTTSQQSQSRDRKEAKAFLLSYRNIKVFFQEIGALNSSWAAEERVGGERRTGSVLLVGSFGLRKENGSGRGNGQCWSLGLGVMRRDWC